jgi:hypothetical protein
MLSSGLAMLKGWGNKRPSFVKIRFKNKHKERNARQEGVGLTNYRPQSRFRSQMNCMMDATAAFCSV